jgi:DNA-binding IclR family transcriptional regulator
MSEDDIASALDEGVLSRLASDKAQRGIQSVEVGGLLLRALAEAGVALPLKELAARAGLTPARAHPYLVSYGRLGLVEQDALAGHYRLGPLALQMGLISLQQSRPVQLASPLLAPLARQIGQTTALSVWAADSGPTIVRIEESPAVIFASMRHGTVFSLVDTATGRLFAAFREGTEVRAVYEAARAQGQGEVAPGEPVPRGQPPSWAAFERQFDGLRRSRLSASEGGLVAGVNALAVPVFDATGCMVLGLTAIGPSGTFDVAADGRIACSLRAAAHSLSHQLGYSA